MGLGAAGGGGQQRRHALYEGAAGERSAGGTVPMTPDTVGWIASMTKAITSVAALQQVEAGRLSLDGPIAEVLPELAAPQVLEGFDADRARPGCGPAQRPDHPAASADPYQSASALHVECRTSSQLYAGRAAFPGVHLLPAPVPLSTPLVWRTPATAWNYGDPASTGPGWPVEALTGRRLDAGDPRRASPARSAWLDTGFRAWGEAQRARLSAMQSEAPDGDLTRSSKFEVPPRSPNSTWAAVGSTGTAPDYLSVCRMRC